jgi:hypothetical protein
MREPFENSPSLHLIADKTATYTLGEISVTATDEEAETEFRLSVAKLRALSEAEGLGTISKAIEESELQAILTHLAKRRAEAAAKANGPDAGGAA